MTNLEMMELEKVLQIDVLKDHNSYQIDELVYTHKNDKILVTGKIPVSVIQELSMIPDSKTCFLQQLLSSNSEDGNYFRRIELSTIEEFVLLFQYMEDYAISKRGLSGNSKDMCDDIINETIENVFNKVNLRLPNEEWIRKKHCLEGPYQEYVKKLSKKPFFKTDKSMAEYNSNLNIRKNIDNFDSCVNPYINNITDLKKISSLRDKLTISIDNLNLGSEGAMLKVVDNTNGNYVIYQRTNTSFSYEVGYYFRGSLNNFKHSFELNNSKCDKTGPGERIIITEKDSNTNREKQTVFNITTDQIISLNYEILPASIEQKNKIYDEILAATAYAEDITRKMFKEKIYTKK